MPKKQEVDKKLVTTTRIALLNCVVLHDKVWYFIALGDRYRKFYRTLNYAKKNIQFNIQLNFSQNIHS